MDFTSEQLKNLLDRAVLIGRMSERAQFRTLLDTLILNAAAQEAKAIEKDKEGQDKEVEVHHLARLAYQYLRQQYKINEGIYEHACEYAPAVEESDEDEVLKVLGQRLTQALNNAGKDLGMGPLVETECGCCGIKIICSESHKLDRCPRCKDHNPPEPEKAH